VDIHSGVVDNSGLVGLRLGFRVVRLVSK
jgi:hypothetical protein